MKKELVAGLVAVIIAGAWWGFRVLKRREWEGEVRENARRRAEAEKTETTTDDEAEDIIKEELAKGPDSKD